MRKIRKAEKQSSVFARDLRKNMSEAEHKLWAHLRMKNLNGYRFRRQHPIGPYIADFVCVREKLVVEVDGATHSTDAEIAHDQRRSKFLTNKGWAISCYSNENVFKHIDDVLDDINAHLKGLK